MADEAAKSKISKISVSFELKHPAPATMTLRTHGLRKRDLYSSWPSEVIRKMGWEGKKDGVLCVHYVYQKEQERPTHILVELSPEQPKKELPETKPPPDPKPEAKKRVCRSCGQPGDAADLFCQFCGVSVSPPASVPVPQR